ncbi:PilC/PilY family type IV pilus protein [Pseudomonas chengduensis]|nr:PilC/PilY family type IV pilus protein [Pseudomonas chengduensis]MDH0959811.1 PilC/PilY family type IV pilus protein [Pseudomonas chengduensis]
MPTNDGAAWWRVDADVSRRGFSGWGTNADFTADTFDGGARINFNQAGGADATWKKFIYLFPNGNTVSAGGRIYGDGTHDHYAVPPLPAYAYFRSVEYNKAYFDPAQTYAPWPSVGGKTFTNMPANAAKADPWLDNSMTFNLTTNVEGTGANNTFRLYDGMPVPAGTKIYLNGSWVTLAASGVVPFTSTPGNQAVNNNVSYPISYFPASFYSSQLLPESYGYTATPLRSGFSPGAVTADLYLYEIKPANFTATEKYQAAIQNFANWFSYYRKRQLATRGGVAASFKDMTTIRAATFRINNRTDLTMRNLAVNADRDSFFSDVLTPTGSGGTPNREALVHAGEQLRRTNAGAPIQFACQANATILFTDGFSNASTPNPSPGNADGDQGSPYADTVSDTMADIAMKYYKTPLRTGTNFPEGRVRVPDVCSTAGANIPPGTNCNTNLHMLTYGVTLGSKGILFDPDADPQIDPYANPPTWWTSFTNRSPRAVDDLWHATINGRGKMLNASTPAGVADAIKTALTTIVSDTGSSSAVATNSTRLEADTFIYQAKFDSSNWSGELLAFRVGSTGQATSQVWSTDNGIPVAADRNIVTWTGSQAINFTVDNWDSLSTVQRDALNKGEADSVGQARLNWLRGSNAREVGQTNGIFRSRTKLLGDIVNSDPLYVKSEDFGFSLLPTEGATYAAYVAGKQSRTPMLYVGANDGMLHGFNASNGNEVFAFIPAGVYGTAAAPKLAALTDPAYTHQYFVDGSARASDAYLNSTWKTILVGSTGAGGKSVFAIDVSNPGSLGASSVLWEFSTAPDATHKLGVAMSNPVISRLASGDWVAIFGNGYDSGDNVKLFVVRLSDGQLLRAIDTGISGAGNGLATPLPVDTNNDRITDVVYAGDLLGNMWKFDLTNTNSSRWDVAYKQGTTPRPLIRVVDAAGNGQPITARATAGRNPEAGTGVMVYFGTGKYFETGDNVVGNSPQLQRFYGVYDGGNTVSMADLVQQTVTNEGTQTGFGAFRVTSANTVNYPTKKGFYLDLRSPGAANGAGERVVSQALLREGRVIFTTLIPSENACDFGGKSWLMELDATNGSRLEFSVFDVNGDGIINDNDFVTLPDGSKVPAGGKGFDEIIKTPGIISAGELEYKYTSGSSGSLGVTTEKGAGGKYGRQSWRQLQ